MPKPDLTNYSGREHAYIKHYLLKEYLSGWGYKIGNFWDPLVFIDGFAGPWGTKDKEFADASFGIGITALNESVDGLLKTRNIVVRGLCVFVENKRRPFNRLDEFARSHSTEQVGAIALRGRFIDQIARIDLEVAAVGTNPFKFVFLDQKGWAATPMAKLKLFVGQRPSELLFNLMTSFLTRFVNRKDLTSSYDALFGRVGVIDRIRSLPKGTGQREEAAVDEYCKSLRDICCFKYVSQAIVMDSDKERVRYFLVFATNSLHGIEVFKKAELLAAEAQDELRQEKRAEKSGQKEFLFEDVPLPSPKMFSLHVRYINKARDHILQFLRDAQLKKMAYADIYGEAMAFPLVTHKHLRDWMIDLSGKGLIKIQWDGPNRKKLSWRKNDSVQVTNATLIR